MKNTKPKIAKINLIMNAWEQVAPGATFGGKSLQQFKTAMAPALESQARVAALLAELEGERQKFQINSDICYRIATQMASSVKGDGEYGDDCPLYSAMGYVRRSNRKSGLKRKAQAPAAPAESEKQS